MTTKRQLRLARAIEDLSARDMSDFNNYVMANSQAASKQIHSERLLSYAERLLSDLKKVNEKKSEKAK